LIFHILDTPIHIYIHAYTYIYTRLYIYIYTPIHIYMNIKCISSVSHPVTFLCTHMYAYTNINACDCVCACVCVCVCVHTYIYIYIHIEPNVWNHLRIQSVAFPCTHMYAYTNINACDCVLCECVRVCVCVCVCACIHTSIYTHILIRMCMESCYLSPFLHLILYHLCCILFCSLWPTEVGSLCWMSTHPAYSLLTFCVYTRKTFSFDICSCVDIQQRPTKETSCFLDVRVCACVCVCLQNWRQ